MKNRTHQMRRKALKILDIHFPPQDSISIGQAVDAAAAAINCVDNIYDRLFPCVPDYDGTTTGNPDGISLLVSDTILEPIKKALAGSVPGVILDEVAGEVGDGRYGGSFWEGAVVMGHPDNAAVVFVVYTDFR